MMFVKWLFLTVIYLELTYGKIVPNVRLPTSITPHHYRIKLIPILETEDFRLLGNIRMDFTVTTATDVIVMHASNLSLINKTVKITPLKGGSSRIDPEDEVITRRRRRNEGIKINRITYDDDREFVKISLASKLKSNRTYQLNCNYRATLAQDLLGFYRGYYLDKKTQTKKWYATTQMEPTFARRAFPCLDEPAMKATFEIILGRQMNMTSLSNMPLIKTESMRHKEGWFWDFYQKSVPMPTYLVAFLVSDFTWQQSQPLIRKNINESGQNSSTEIRIWSRSEVIDQSALAIHVTVKMLEFLENYFQVPYPLPKLDLVAVPDFSASAMENWGIVIFRETALLHDPQSPVTKEHLYVQEVIAHELAHQWFGNLVTMKWWNDLWLNEGFASYVELRVLQQISPEYEVVSLMIHDTQAALMIDSLDSSHPISVDIQHPDQIDEISDAITYNKGSAIIRMMNHFLGESSFRQGLTNYLNQYKYRNAQQDDLWSMLTNQWHFDSPDSRNMNVKSIMDTWTLQMGYPLVTISRNYSHQTVTIEQKRFLRSTNVLLSDNEVEKVKERSTSFTPNYRWWIPISLTDSQSLLFDERHTQPQIWLSPENLSLQHQLTVNESSWILANIQVTGYYRVNYDTRNWQLLKQQLLNDHRVIHVMNRAQLIDDIFALASIKTLSYPMAFDLIQYLPKEDHYVPWTTAIRCLSYVNRMLTYATELGRFKTFLLSLVKPALLGIGEDIQKEEEPLKKLVRISLMEQACQLGYSPCIHRAQQQFEMWMNHSDPVHYTEIHPDIRLSVYCTAIKHGSQLEWDFAWQMALNATSAQHQETLFKALGCSREPWILIRYLSLILDSESGIRKQDSRRIIDAVASNPVGRPLAFQFIQDHWSQLLNYFGGPYKTLESLRRTASDFNTQADLNKIKSFLGKKSADLETTQATYKKLLATVATNIEWMEENYQPLVQWLKNRGF